MTTRTCDPSDVVLHRIGHGSWGLRLPGHAGFYVWQHEGGSHYAVADYFGTLVNVGPARSRSQVPEALIH